MSLEDIVQSLATNIQQFQQETRSSIQNLENQVSQLATSLNKLESQGKLPSQTVVNQKENVSAITLRSGKELEPVAGKRRGHGLASDAETEVEVDVQPEQPEKSAPLEPKIFEIRPPFPERLAKTKKEKDEKEILETLRKVEVNIPLLDAIKQIPRYAKFLKELCTNKSIINE